MSKFYYPRTDPNYPEIMLALNDAMIYYMCTHLYPDEDFSTSKDHMLRANFEAGTEHGLRQSIKQYNKVSAKFPFTAYNLSSSEEEKSKRNYLETSGLYFSKTYEKYIKALPINIDYLMMSFFTNPDDYYYAEALLYEMNGRLQRLIIPITVDGKLDAFSADITFEVTKGNLAFQYEEQRDRGRIYDLSHTAKIYVHYFVIPDVAIYPVDDIEASIGILDAEHKDLSVPKDTFLIPDTPIVSTTSPDDEDTDVPVDSNIVITFNVEMNEESVESLIQFDPYISAELEWNNDSKILTIDIVEDLQSATEYTVFIPSEVKSFYTNNMENDYTFTFTTV